MQDMHTRRRVPGATGQIKSINREISLAEDGLVAMPSRTHGEAR